GVDVRRDADRTRGDDGPRDVVGRVRAPSAAGDLARLPPGERRPPARTPTPSGAPELIWRAIGRRCRGSAEGAAGPGGARPAGRLICGGWVPEDRVSS